MANTGFHNFDHSIEKTNLWLKDIESTLGTEDRAASYRALRATLHALRDRMPLEEAVDLGAQLPMMIRGLYYEGWQPNETPIKEKDQQEFLDRIQKGMPGKDYLPPQRATTAVFQTVEKHIDSGQIRHVKQMLPDYILSLWRGDAPQNGAS